MSDARPRIGVIVFPGSNDDGDAALAVEAIGGDAVLVWHAEPELPEVSGLILPGGFSYGDYLRCGAIARFAPVMADVARFVKAGGPVLGVCNGFQILCEAGLLPGVLRPNECLRFVCEDVTVRVEPPAPILSRCRTGDELVLPVKHGEGCWFAPANLVANLEASGQIALRYVAGGNPNGSVADVAGVTNRAGNVLGLMPHPEHAVDALCGSPDGALIIGSLVDAARNRLPAPV